MNAERRSGILLADERTSALFWLLLLAYFAIFLTFFFVILTNSANSSVERGGKIVVVHRAHFPNTVLPRSCDTEWMMKLWHVKVALWSRCPSPAAAPCCDLLLHLLLEMKLGTEPILACSPVTGPPHGAAQL